MAEAKKSTTKEIAKAEEIKEVSEAEVKAEKKSASRAEGKEPAKRTTTRRTAVKKETAAKKEPAKRTSAKKETEVKKEPAKRGPGRKAEAKKAEVKESVNFQFNGRSYTSEDILKSCKDVWKYDLNGNEEDLKSIELYVKPDENVVYYVINDEIKGSFPI